jgi:hypothetical protein
MGRHESGLARGGHSERLLIGKKLLRCLRPFDDFLRRFNGVAMAETVACTQIAALGAPYHANALRAPTSCASAATGGGLRHHKIFTCV